MNLWEHKFERMLNMSRDDKFIDALKIKGSSKLIKILQDYIVLLENNIGNQMEKEDFELLGRLKDFFKDYKKNRAYIQKSLKIAKESYTLSNSQQVNSQDSVSDKKTPNVIISILDYLEILKSKTDIGLTDEDNQMLFEIKDFFEEYINDRDNLERAVRSEQVRILEEKEAKLYPELPYSIR